MASMSIRPSRPLAWPESPSFFSSVRVLRVAVRTGGNWTTEGPSPGHYDFSEIDQLFSPAKADGLTVLFELGKSPNGTRRGNVNAPPSDCYSRLRAAPR